MDYHKYYNNDEREKKIKLIESKTYSFFYGYNNGITDMSSMFYEYSSLSSLPDISKWNTNNVTDMSGMFYGCSYYHLYLIFQNGIQIMLLI